MSGHPGIAEIGRRSELNGLYRLAPGTDLPAAISVPGARLTGKAGMLNAVSEALHFPDYFDANWDALEECITDLSWLAGDVRLLIDDAAIPEQRAPEAWGVLLDILADAARFWADQGRPFAVFLQGGHAAYPMIAA